MMYLLPETHFKCLLLNVYFSSTLKSQVWLEHINHTKFQNDDFESIIKFFCYYGLFNYFYLTNLLSLNELTDLPGLSF